VRNPTHPVSDSDNIRSRATVIRSPRDVAAERGLLMSPWTGSVKRFGAGDAGAVCGAEALDLLKAWGTGHPGGLGLGALRRVELLIQEAVVTVPCGLIAETIDLIAVLSGAGPADISPNSPALRGWDRAVTTEPPRVYRSPPGM
jgi:hypothetical protein